MDSCICCNSIKLYDGEDVDYNGGFLVKTVEICSNCEYLYINYYSFGWFQEGLDYENYEGSFSDFSDKNLLDNYLEELKSIT